MTHPHGPQTQARGTPAGLLAGPSPAVPFSREASQTLEMALHPLLGPAQVSSLGLASCRGPVSGYL